MANWGAAGQGAAGGAAAGAPFGPWGAVIGGAAGGLMGLLSPDKEAEAMRILSGVQEQVGPLAAEDPELKRRQMAALEQMYAAATQGGMDPQSRAALLQAERQTAAAERGARGAIQQNAQARGVGGSGVEFLASLGNQQGAAERNSLAGTNAAGDARTRALQAMAASQTGYGQVRGQDLNAAQARSQVEQFNAQQRLRKGLAMAGKSSDIGTQNRNDTAGAYDALGAVTNLAAKPKDKGGWGWGS